MEVEEESTSNHLEESVAAETTTVIDEILIGNPTSTDKESEKELTELISESDTREEENENSSLPVPKSEDTEASAMAAAGGKEVDEKAEEDVHCQNTDSVSASALNGGIENSVVIESVNVVEDSKDVDDGAVNEFDVPSDDVAAVECGGSEVPCAVNDADGEVFLIPKDENEGDEKETVEEGGGQVLEDCEGDEVKAEFGTECDTNIQLEGDELTDDFKRDDGTDLENVQEIVGSDVRNDGGDVQVENVNSVVQPNEAEEVVKEEEMVADKEEAAGVTEDVKKEVFLADEEAVDGVSENDEKDTMVEDEEKSLDTEKLLDTEMETEKSVETEMETEKSVEPEMETEKSVEPEMETEKSVEPEMETEKSVDTEMETEKSVDTEMETEKSVDTEMENEKSVDTEMENEEEENLADEEKGEEVEDETELSTKGGAGKRKRGGKISKATPKSSVAPRKPIEEDVCFICYDGGDLVLCDRRNCPKAYHPACVNRDEAYFQSKGRWNCGWHLCSICEKKADYMCYTCTYSLCKACTRTTEFLRVREKEKRGLCDACKDIVMSIEKQESQENMNFDDQNGWEHLFKDYWLETKEKHNLSLDELEQAKSPRKGSGKQESRIAQPDIKDDNGSGSDNPPENLKTRKSKRNTKKQKSNKESDSSTGAVVGSVGSRSENTDWVSKDLLEFVTHMRNGDSSVISQFEVQDLLLEYIKRNKLRDPSHKSQIICDARLENLFGKPRVAHIEMLKLLESHFLVKEDCQTDDVQGTVVDTEISPVDDKEKKRKGRKKSDKRGPQPNREDYAAIDIHNISLIYLRRKLVEDLLDDMERFNGIIVGTFVRIRISGAHQKQDIYRLVQVTGTSEAAWYTLSKRTTCTMLEILNLDKTETISIDSISNQDFMEDECKRLRQSIKCGLISRLSVGDVLDKAMELQAVRVNDWFETEIVRLNHLRDRAKIYSYNIMRMDVFYGSRISSSCCYPAIQECVEKLNVLKTPEERARRLEEFPLIHEDPTMDPEYGSEDDTDPDDKKQELYKRSDSFRFNRREKDQFSPRGDYTSKDSWSGTPRGSSGKSHEFTESWSGTPRSSSGKNKEFTESWSTPRSSSARNHEFTESWSGTPRSSSSKNYELTKNSSSKSFSIKAEDATTSSSKVHRENSRDPFVQQPIIIEKPIVASLSIAAESAPKINEAEKMWHYKDPSEKIQGPFSMVQLRKWSKNGYFPVGLKIWRKSDKEDDSILLADALEGKFTVVAPGAVNQDGQSLTRDHTHGAQISSINPDSDRRHAPADFPSPSSNKGTIGWAAGQSVSLTGPSSPAPNNAHLIACGNKDGNLAGSIGVSILQPHDSSTNPVPVAAAVAPQNVCQGDPNSVQSTQFVQPVAPPDSNMQPQMVQAQGWSQNMQPNLSMNMAGLQPLVYNQWTGVPNMVQNPGGNFMPAPQEQWAQQFPFPVNQPNMQQPPQPLQPNVNWGAMAGNPNMGWVGPNTGNPMNWAPVVQGPQVTGTVDPTWMMQAGNVQASWVPQPTVQGVVPNQSWVATPIQGPLVAGNGNPSWVGPVLPGNNQVAPAAGWVQPAAPNVNQVPTNMNTGWVSAPGNQGAPVPNQGWVPPSGNQGAPPPGSTKQNWGPRNRGGRDWGGNDNRGNFSGPRRNNRGYGFGGNKRSYNNRHESFHRDGGSNDRDDRSYDRDERSNHKDSGSFHGDDSRSKDSGSSHGDGARRPSRSPA
ncbi:hypothetical protein SSX86_028585 [Deinandra increscens subsp. villosa]|uniref:Uncharacterized protein n=1 Tax=Deinandra increscens subsp. villosa TaxID=3103831 RepID=A0AAP0GKM4_9ASTR